MATEFQVTIDCASPHELADWWAEALGWTVEPSDEAFIRRMVEAGHATQEDTTTHKGVLVWKDGQAINSPDPGRPRVLFQRSDDAKTGKNRLHLDLRFGEPAQQAAVDRLTAMGATELWRGRQGPHTWVTMADPEGNEFCVA
jgi:hypothetical protein